MGFPPAQRPSDSFDSRPNPGEEDDYDREMNLSSSALLNGGGSGRGPSKASHPFRSLTPKRIAIIAGGLLFVIFWIGKGTGGGRRGQQELESEFSNSHDYNELEGQPLPDLGGAVDESPEDEGDIPLSDLPDSSPQNNQGLTSSKTCTPPPGKKAESFALMIDAGSTGSRLHLYTFSHCDPSPGALPKLEDEGFFTTNPGLSSYAGRPAEAAESLRGLMESAMKGVPEEERSCTPVAVKATAGLRLLGASESDAILDEVERWMKEEWPFSLVKDGVAIMDGRDEGSFDFLYRCRGSR